MKKPCAMLVGHGGMNWLVGFFLFMAVAAGVIVSPDLAGMTICDCLGPFVSHTPLRERWRHCSDVEQVMLLERSRNIVSRPSDVEGWECYTPADPEKPGWLAVRLLKDRDDVVFFPRLVGPDSSITVLAEDTSQQFRSIFRLAGAGSVWTPLSAQYALDLRCVRYGRSSATFQTVVLLRLSGGSTQLWHKNSVVFF